MNKMMLYFTRLITACVLVVFCSATAQNFSSTIGGLDSMLSEGSSENVTPFVVTLSQNEPKEINGKRVKSFTVDVKILPNHYLYKDHFVVSAANGTVLPPTESLPAVQIKDPFTGETKSVYKSDFQAEYVFPDGTPTSSAKVEYMGCNPEMCFMPQELEKTFTWPGEAEIIAPTTQSISTVTNPPVSVSKWSELADSFAVVATETGSMDKTKFFKFLDRAQGSAAQTGAGDESAISRSFSKYGLPLTLLLIVLLGIGLNLTPCVLPMIPINLAIIGAGVKAGSKVQGLCLGGIYGLGMAVAYGCLGLAVVVAGSTFGALNASPWFNFITAIIFVILALAMFDVFVIDFSRFQKTSDVRSKTGLARYLLIFGLGVFSALLAGACVAPVLIAVLLLASSLYSAGNYVGLLLPFFLGIGMALPWPIAGAGIGSLPKPGMWMVRVKQVFGVLILLFAARYAYVGYTLWEANQSHSGLDSAEVQSAKDAATTTMPALDAQLAAGMQNAIATGKPLFIDFWATWCKSCMYMEATTFADKEVQQRLESEFVVLKLQAEQPRKSPASEILSHYNVMGLPTYLILIPPAND